MKTISALKLVQISTCAILAVGLSASALASCGDTLAAMASGNAVVSQPSSRQEASSDPGTHKSIVGLWNVFFNVGGNTIQEAYQIWNLGGTEVHNPNVDPRGGNVCFGAWTKTASGTYKLTHRVWNYDTNGNFNGQIYLHETVTLSKGGGKQSGTFRLDFYDPSGNFLTEVSGQVAGQRIGLRD
jgi:hypothetical protein